MDGLEAVEINISDLERTKRVDAEFYKKDNLSVLSVLNTRTIVPLKRHFQVSDGNHMKIKDDFSDEGIRYYKGQDIYNFFIEEATPICISESVYNSPYMKRSHLKKGDMLLSIVGAIIGNVAIVNTDDRQTCSCKLAILRPNKGISSSVAAVYLKCRYGQNQIQKFRRGTAQTGLLLEDADQIYIPVFSMAFGDAIEKCVALARKHSYSAVQTYKNAETRLLSALGLDNFTPCQDPVAIKSLSESFGKSGRLDAEYYQRKYEDYENALNTNFTVKSLPCQIHDGLFSPRSGDYKYIELSDIGTAGNIAGCTIAPFDELPSRARRKVKAGQVIVSSIEGSLSSCALISEEYDGALCSTGFYVVDSNKINSETLLVLFKSAPIQALMKKRCSGTILTAISKSTLEEMPLPLIDGDTQKQITKDLQHSFALRRQSEQLLDIAKHAVEIAIEQGEDAALEWLNVRVEGVNK